MRTCGFVLALALFAAACNGNGTTSTIATTAATTSTLSVPTSTLPPVVDCPGEGEFEEGGGIAEFDATGSDSSTIGRISWETSDRCETFHFDFETSEGAPATTVPAITVDHLESFQVVRMSMDIDASVVTDQLIETELVDRLYVVRALDGSMFVDLHLSEPAAVRATILSSPARLSIDLRPGFVPFVGESTIDDQFVLVSPPDQAQVESPIEMVGYSRTDDDTVLVLVSQAGSIVTETETTAPDTSETWGEFRLDLSLPAGEVSVFLGQRSTADGSLAGISVDLTVS
ncbi:MAG TPA: Gmad2 immunoglobulin-like domain-containing protein [Acidimicrobiia bacterium]